MKEKHIKLYMKLAIEFSNMSFSNRKKVGALIVKDNNIIGFGWNGTPSGFDNNCEDEKGVTKDEVIHAEMNIIAKCARQNINTADSILFTTLSPCFNCAKLLLESGIKEIYYLEEYRDKKAIEFLKKTNIKLYNYYNTFLRQNIYEK